MKTAIIYYSKHHGNTKKLLNAIADKSDVTLIDAAENLEADLSGYDLIGFASGIYYGKFHKSVIQFAKNHLPNNEKVFFLYTCGSKRKSNTAAIKIITDTKGATDLGEYGCIGFDTFGPFKLFGGMGKGRPNEEDIEAAVKFFEEINDK